MAPRWSPNPRSLLSRAELRARGVHSRRLASEEFIEVIPGFMTPSSAPAELQLIARTLQREAFPGAVISHITAAELLRVPLPSTHEYAQAGVAHCTVPLAERRRAGPRVMVHTRTGPTPMRCRGLELSSPIALLCELGGMLEHDALVACCDQLMSVATLVLPRPSLQSLRRQVKAASGLHGIKRVRAALANARERVESPKETEMRLLMQRSGFGAPVVNYEIRRSEEHTSELQSRGHLVCRLLL